MRNQPAAETSCPEAELETELRVRTRAKNDDAEQQTVNSKMYTQTHTHIDTYTHIETYTHTDISIHNQHTYTQTSVVPKGGVDDEIETMKKPEECEQRGRFHREREATRETRRERHLSHVCWGCNLSTLPLRAQCPQ